MKVTVNKISALTKIRRLWQKWEIKMKIKHDIVEKITKLRNKVIMILFMIIFTCQSMTVYAGFGDFNDYDYGDSDWDTDWDSDWDSGGSDWGKSYGSSYSSSYSNDDEVNIPLVIIVLVIVIIISVSKSKSANTSAKGVPASNKTSNQQHRNGHHTRATKQPVKVLPDRTQQITQIVQQKDENFTANDFISYVKRVYVDIQDAWSKRDLEPVRSVIHPNLYQQTQRQIEKKIEDGIINYLERISVNTAYLTGYVQDDDYEYMIVYLTAKMIDYQIKEATGEILYGDKTTRWDMYYKMTFMRAINMQTLDITQEDNMVMKCPNCGAPVEGTAFGECEYCGSIVSSGKYGWVLSDFGVVRNDTVDEGIQLNNK